LRKSQSRIIKLEQAGLEIFTKITAELDAFRVVYGVVEEASEGGDTDSKACRFHGQRRRDVGMVGEGPGN
jgi:hypothetical protein